MMPRVFCQRCKRKLNNTPFIGEPIIEFEDGLYCYECAKAKKEKARKGGKEK